MNLIFIRMAFVTLQDLSLFTVYAGFKHVESWWNFKNVISPFYRLYYIEKGKGRVYIDNIPYDLVPGHLFLSLLFIVMNAVTLWIIIIFAFLMILQSEQVFLILPK